MVAARGPAHTGSRPDGKPSGPPLEASRRPGRGRHYPERVTAMTTVVSSALPPTADVGGSAPVLPTRARVRRAVGPSAGSACATTLYEGVTARRQRILVMKLLSKKATYLHCCAPSATRTRDLLLRRTLLCRLGSADPHVSDRFDSPRVSVIERQLHGGVARMWHGQDR
jgi:hypothetical protein